MREDAFRGEAVKAVFDNLLPDSDALRRRVAQEVGAAGSDAYSLLAAIGPGLRRRPAVRCRR
ncbi:HipA N-terminal domain-containing protein [Bradyrhizobium sp. Lot33]